MQERRPAETVKHHVIAHESWHLILAGQARAAGSNRFFLTTDERMSADAVPLLLDALRRFDRMEKARILALIHEIGTRAENGISYTDDSKRHRLAAFPGETFTGLHLLCLLYAGLRRALPAESETGMDFNDEFATALELYHASRRA